MSDLALKTAAPANDTTAEPTLGYMPRMKKPDTLTGHLLSMGVGAIILLACIPALYGVGAIDITTVNQLGRFLAIAIVALGIDLVWGYTGILTLCQAMFFCFGGYAIGMHMALHGPLDGDGQDIPRALFVVSSEVSGLKLPWFWRPFQGLPLTLILGMLLPGLFAFVFGYFAFRSRVRGVYFSIITQATTLAATLVFRKNEMRLCGTNGLTNFVTLAGFDLQKPAVKMGLYFVTAIVLFIVYGICVWVVRSRAGRLLKAVRDNESRLRFAGYQPVTFKVFIFVLGAILAAIGGMLYTPQNGIITPYKMDPIVSIVMVVYVAVGGRGTLLGAVVGALLVSYMESILTSRMPLAWPFILGGLFVVVTLLLPDGIVGASQKLIDRLRKVEART
jgi:urea transport system permease protein